MLLLETPSKQRKLSGSQSSPVGCKKVINLEDQDMKKLRELFPTCKDEELQDVLETSENVDDAIATMVAFSSPQKTDKSENKKHGHHVVVIDDDDIDDDIDDDDDDDDDDDVHDDVDDDYDIVDNIDDGDDDIDDDIDDYIDKDDIVNDCNAPNGDDDNDYKDKVEEIIVKDDAVSTGKCNILTITR